MTFSFLKAKERLIRIMGTFDLATGHADTFDELLDSLESELRDVLGHYREALAQPEPWEKFCDSNCVWTDHHPDCKLVQPEQAPVAWLLMAEETPRQGQTQTMGGMTQSQGGVA